VLHACRWRSTYDGITRRRRCAPSAGEQKRVAAQRRSCERVRRAPASTSPTTSSTCRQTVARGGAARHQEDGAVREPRPRAARCDGDEGRDDRGERVLDARRRLRRIPRRTPAHLERREHHASLYEDEVKRLEELVSEMRRRAKISETFAPRLKAAESRLRQFLEKNERPETVRDQKIDVRLGGAAHRQARPRDQGARDPRPHRPAGRRDLVRRAGRGAREATAPARATSSGSSRATTRCSTTARSASGRRRTGALQPDARAPRVVRQEPARDPVRP
jgi:hypothetical protein